MLHIGESELVFEGTSTQTCNNIGQLEPTIKVDGYLAQH